MNTGSLAGLDSAQRANAGIITRIGRSMGASARDIAVAIMTAMDESSLHNLTGGDRDSAGLFQQRPSAGWGSYAQVTDPVYATRTFFNHLLAVKNRNAMTPWAAAQAVQVSAWDGTPDSSNGYSGVVGGNYQRYWAGGANGFQVGATQIAGKELGLSPAQLARQGSSGGALGVGAGASGGLHPGQGTVIGGKINVPWWTRAISDAGAAGADISKLSPSEWVPLLAGVAGKWALRGVFVVGGVVVVVLGVNNAARKASP